MKGDSVLTSLSSTQMRYLLTARKLLLRRFERSLPPIPEVCALQFFFPPSSQLLLSTSSPSTMPRRVFVTAVVDAAAALPGGALAGVRALHARGRVPQPRRHGLRLLPDARLARRRVADRKPRHRHGVPARVRLESHRAPRQLLHFTLEPLRLHHSHLFSHWFLINPIC